MLKVILGSFGAFPIFLKTLYLENGWRYIYLNLYVIQFYVVIVCHLDKQSVKAPGFLVRYIRTLAALLTMF